MKNTLSILGVSILLFLMLYKSHDKSEQTNLKYADIVSFEMMVNEAIKNQKEEYVSYAKQQQQLLEEIKVAVDIIKNQKEKVIAQEATRVEQTPVIESIRDVTPQLASPKKNTTTKQSPVRLPGSHWNVNGNNRYSLLEIANHLRTTHNIDPSGYTYEELTIMHDNLHNGHSAMGYSRRADCPDGTCPK